MKFSQLREACKNLRESRKFQFFVSIIIIYSSLVIGVDSYTNGKYIELLIIYSDYFITIIFLTELLIRFTAEKTIKDFLSDGWNIFDTIIVVASLVPSSASDSILVLRLLRLLRLLRIISFVPELRSVVENLIKSLSKSVYILVLIFLITYIYAVAGAQIFSDIEESKFTNLGTSLLTLAQVATLSGWEDVMNPILIEKPLAWVYFVSYIFIVAIVILNLFIAILVDVVNPLSD
jgi:voltage-gated sodium channel